MLQYFESCNKSDKIFLWIKYIVNSLFYDEIWKVKKTVKSTSYVLKFRSSDCNVLSETSLFARKVAFN